MGPDLILSLQTTGADALPPHFVIADPAIPAAILDRARADAQRLTSPQEGTMPKGLVVILERA